MKWLIPRPFTSLRKCCQWLVLAAVCSVLPQTQAGSYGPQTFTFANGTTNLGDGSAIASNDGTASVQDNALRLTRSGGTNTNASYKLPNLDGSERIESFDFTFNLRMSASGTPADGFSINYGLIPSGNGGGESGFALNEGLVIAWDTYNNGSDNPSIEVFANGVSVGNFPQTFAFDATFRAVSIHWDENGLDITFGGTVVCTDLPTPGFVPKGGNRFAFSARTGGLSQDVYLDNLSVTTTKVVPIETGGPVISEFVAANADSYEDEDTDNSDWIEIYNGQSTTVNLQGWTLTNSAGNRTMWTFPSVSMGPYSYRVVFASGKNRVNGALPLHTNFALPREGGYVALVKPGGTEVASEYTYGEQADDVSYGESGTARVRGYLYPSTPGAANSSNPAPGTPAEEVVFSRPGGLITGAISLTIAAPVEAGAVVRYTTNNTPPTASSPAYSGPINISSTSTIRARVFAPDRLPGPVSSRTFLRVDPSLLNYNGSGQPFSSNLPIVVLDSFGVQVDSFTAENNRGYRFTYGVVIAPDPVTGRATITDTPQFSGRGGTHIRGESSAGFPQKQYAWELWNNEDQDKNESLLGLPPDSDWILYAPWSEKTLMRDILVFGTMRKLRSDYMAARTKFCEVFFNQSGATSVAYGGSYRGIYVLKEKLKIDKERLNLAKVNSLTTQQPAVTGGYIFRKDKPDADSTSWTTGAPYNIPLQSYDPDFLNTAQFNYLNTYINTFQNTLASGSFANPTTGYAAYIERDTFIDAQWFVEWTKQVDGYVFSTYFHKDRNGKMRAGPIWDFNISLGNADYNTGDAPTGWLYDTPNGRGQLWYPRLHDDPTYRLRHWDRYWHLRRGVLATPAIMADIDAYASQLLNGSTTPVTNNMPPLPPLQENAVMRHYRKYQRLGQYDWPNGPGVGSRIYYNSNGNPVTGEVDYMKNWLQTRLNWLDDQNRTGSVIYRPPTLSHYGGKVEGGLELTMERYTGTAPAGTTYANGTIHFTLDGTDPRAANGTISSNAQVYSGPVVLNVSANVVARLYNSGTWSPAAKAVFLMDVVPASAANLVVSELHYNPAGPTTAEATAGFTSGNDFEYIELLNVSTQTVDLTGVTIEEGIQFDFANAGPETLILPPGGRVVIAENKNAFLFRYGTNPSVRLAGSFSGNLSNSGEQITVRAANSSIIAQFAWGEAEPWPVAADGSGYSLVLNDPAANPAYGEGGSWRASAELGGKPGLADSTPFTGSPDGDTDKDGLSDFLEYAMGSNPANAESAFAPEADIAPFFVDNVAGDYLRFQFRRNLAADGCNYTVMLSNDSETWATGAERVTYVGTVHNGDGTATVTYRSTQPYSPTKPKVFMRLRVSP